MKKKKRKIIEEYQNNTNRIGVDPRCCKKLTNPIRIIIDGEDYIICHNTVAFKVVLDDPSFILDSEGKK